MSQVLDSLENARSAAARHAWRDAYDAYSQVDRGELTALDLEQFAEATWWRGKLDEAINLRERSYARYSADGAGLDAARLALTLSWDHSGRGAFAVSDGWFKKAERLVESEPESTVSARLALTRAITTMFAGMPAEAIPDFEHAFDLARRLGDKDTEALALVGRGRALVKMGEIDEGLALLDEATASAVCGELQPYSAGLVYCITISSCNDLGDYRRAAEWTEAANRWCDQLDVTGFPGACRVHRAEVMRLRGDLAMAEKQAVEACEELHDFERSVTAAGYYEIGEIRRRLGDFPAAEEAYGKADELGREPQPGLALLRLAEGKVDAAVAGIRRTLEERTDPLSRLRTLPAQVEIAIAASNLRTARAARNELEQIVDAYKIAGRRATAFDATLHEMDGRISLAEDDTEAAVGSLRRARDAWREVGAPHETAQARMLLGMAFRRQGDEHAANAEFDAALGTFEEIGARLDAERAKELLGRVQMRRTFLFTDIVDSTRLLETLGNDKWRRLLARHDDLLRERIVQSGGEVIKQVGDGFFAAFDGPRGAVEAAVGIQRALADEIVAPDVRIGVHTGGAFRANGKQSDYGGEGVHVAARIGAAAGAAEILVSAETIDGVGTAFPVSEPRPELLKGFEQPIDVVSVDWR
jgi:class 3 adenylate cyclase